MDYFKRKGSSQGLIKGTEDYLKGGYISTSENGWTDNELCLRWFEDCFGPQTSPSKGKYRMLIVDGHASHISTKAIKYCINNNVVLVCLPSHSTDLLQPLDVGVFSPLATAYKLQLEKHTRLGVSYSIDKVDFIQLYGKAREEALTVKNMQSAWAKSGLVPLDSAVVTKKLPQPPTSGSTTPVLSIATQEDEFLLPFTPANAEQVKSLIQLHHQGEADSMAVMEKLTKACNSFMAQTHVQRVTNQELMRAQRLKTERAQ